MFAGQQPALQIPGQAVGPIDALGKDGQPLAGGPLHPPVVMDVAEQQVIALLPPQRPLGRAVAAAAAAAQLPNFRIQVDDVRQFRGQLFNRHRKNLPAWLFG